MLRIALQAGGLAEAGLPADLPTPAVAGFATFLHPPEQASRRREAGAASAFAKAMADRSAQAGPGSATPATTTNL